MLDDDFDTALIAALPALRRYAYKLTRAVEDAEDLVSDAIVRGLAKRHQFRAGTDLRAWLFTIMHSQYVDGLRRSMRHETLLIDDLDGPQTPSVPARQEAGLLLRDLARVLDRMAPVNREVLLCIARGDAENYAAMATAIGVPIGTIRSRLSRGRQSMRKMLG